MALQTSHSAEPAPTSTSSTGSSSGPPPFSPAGSPPLILAFLATGLFAVAMIFTFGWRRIQFGRGWAEGRGLTNQESMTWTPPTKPKLWDLWNGGCVNWTEVAENEKEGQHPASLKWANIMPLSANPVLIPKNGELADPSPIRRHLFHPRLALSNAWPERWQLQKDLERRKSLDISSSILQVGVAILMPSPRYPVYTKKPKHSGYEEEERRQEIREITDYSFGMYECGWDK